jgi:hypothetical protein
MLILLLCHSQGYPLCSNAPRSLETAQAKLPGLHPENKQKQTDKPTAERILKAFSDISLTIIKNAAGDDILRRLTPQ